MAKIPTENKGNSFNGDIEPLLQSDFSHEEKNYDLETSPEQGNHPKKFKSKDKKPSEPSHKTKLDLRRSSLKMNMENNEADKDKGRKKSIKAEKTLVGQFMEYVSSLHQMKCAEIIRKHEEDFDNFQKEIVTKFQKEINKLEKLKKSRLEEIKLMKAQEKQLKVLEEYSTDRKQCMKKFVELHNRAVQAYEKLNTKHTNEALGLKDKFNDDEFGN